MESDNTPGVQDLICLPGLKDGCDGNMADPRLSLVTGLNPRGLISAKNWVLRKVVFFSGIFGSGFKDLEGSVLQRAGVLLQDLVFFRCHCVQSLTHATLSFLNFAKTGNLLTPLVSVELGLQVGRLPNWAE